MGKIIQVTSHNQRGGNTIGEMNFLSKSNVENFWSKYVKKILTGLFITVTGGLILYFLTSKNMADSVFNVTSNYQQGGLTVGQLNVGTPPRHLNDDIKKQLENLKKKKIQRTTKAW